MGPFPTTPQPLHRAPHTASVPLALPPPPFAIASYVHQRNETEISLVSIRLVLLLLLLLPLLLVCSPQIVASCWLTVGSSSHTHDSAPCPLPHPRPAHPSSSFPLAVANYSCFFCSIHALCSSRYSCVFHLQFVIASQGNRRGRGSRRGDRGRCRGVAGQSRAAGASTTNVFVFPMQATRATNGQQSALGGSTLWPHFMGQRGGGRGAGGLCTRRMLNAISNRTTTEA